MRIFVAPFGVCLALLAGCSGFAGPDEPLFEGRDFRVEAATRTDPLILQFLLEVRVNPRRFAVTTLTIDGETWSSSSGRMFCQEWCDLEVFLAPASNWNPGEHRAVVLMVDAEGNIAADLAVMFTVN